MASPGLGRMIPVMLAFAALGAACGSSARTSNQTTTTAAPTTQAPTTTAPSRAPSGGGPTFGSGTKLVNSDIAPGTYVASGGTSCYWERLSGTSGRLDDIIANDYATGRTIATIEPTDKAFKSRGCGDWTKAPTSGTPKSSFGDGTWAVGIDIAPGTYRASGESGCYWARVRGFGGTTDQIIANDYATGSAVVTIASTDKGFVSRRCGDWTATTGGANVGGQTTTTTTTNTGGGGTAASLARCGPGLSATQGVPCELAHNLFYEYYTAVQNGKDTTALAVWSPQVKQYRTAICSKAAGVITCYVSGTTVPNAQVQITQAALDAYTPAQAREYARTHDLGPHG